MGAEFKEGQVARRRIASVNESGKPATMSTRVLQLQSLEPSNARFQQGAYFAHGTNRERTLGEAASDGCLRFSNLDIVEIAHLIGGEGALVDIRDDLPPVPTRRSKPSLQQRESLLSNEKPVVSEAASLILPENDRRFVASIEAKIWPNLDELEARDPLGPRLISIAELKSLLTQEEQDFIDRLLAIDPKTLGIQVPKVPSIEVPRNQLVGLSSSLPHSLEDSVRYPMTPQARAAFLAMRTACAAATKEWINPSSAYRSDGYQLALFITNLNKNNFDLKKTASRVTFPGYSEHGSIRNGNMAMDLQTESAHGDAFLRSQSYTWLTKHAAEYGFSLSYPENNPTGIDFEPWHWRFDRKRWEAQLEKNNPTREDIYRFIVSQSPLDKAVEFTHQPREIIARQLANALVDAMHSNQIPITDVTLAICLAQIEREGEFLLDPPIPNPVKMYNRYKNKALTDIRSRLRQISPHAETVVMPIVLNQVIPRYEKVYRDKIYACKTERDLERILTNIVADLRADKKISSLFSIPFIGDNLRAEFEKGIQILEDPIKRVGMMQVDVDKALSIARAQGKEITRPQMRETLYSLEGNLQYGLNLLAIPIKAYLTDDKGAVECVFADYNAGEFASRNAAVQDYLNTLLRTHDPSFPNLVLDGDLLSYKEARVPNSTLSNSEKAFIQFGKAYKISSLTPDQIRKDLLLEKTPEFEQTLTYRSLRETYAKVFHSQPAYARLPEISTDTAEKLGRPNITTDHYVSGSKRRYTLIQSQMRSRT
ncbi:MAG: hypothetical protein UT55_C0010G0002 [Candidatus Peregrinibacteria bacterium GW2011_GWE2_39_6]|nr:MAG: hypothetical protein UT55_C0010G0002 [Candidatus Peregrinibacteria bacterium GW2011_GWE2_39_6]